MLRVDTTGFTSDLLAELPDTDNSFHQSWALLQPPHTGRRNRALGRDPFPPSFFHSKPTHVGHTIFGDDSHHTISVIVLALLELSAIPEIR